jgi:hypothetical protein
VGLSLAPEVTTRPVAGAGEDAIPESEVLLAGAPTGRVVPGAVLEAAVRWDGRLLLFLTDDIPHEESLGIHLLDAGLRLLDTARLGGPYSTGSFSSLELTEPGTVRFRFIGDTTWSVELLPRPGFRVPFLSEPPGVSRGFGFSRHFIVRGRPRPEPRAGSKESGAAT